MAARLENKEGEGEVGWNAAVKSKSSLRNSRQGNRFQCLSRTVKQAPSMGTWLATNSSSINR